VTLPVVSVALAREYDVVAARQRARQLAALLQFEAQDQTRIATATSEIARNALRYAGGGRVDFAIDDARPQALVIRVSDTGPGIAELDEILGGRYRSATGLGLGVLGTRRLMDGFEIESSPGRGTVVTMRKLVPARAGLVTPPDVGRLADALAREAAGDPVAEVQQQNQELLRALDELRRRQDQLARVNSELEDTNRGVVALYAELDERGEHLRRADELKSRFLSNMSHEFRTPLNSILALSRLLLDRVDGPLTTEQAHQVTFVQKAAEDLFELVNDLLDLAKVEAGKTVIRPVEFTVEHLFGALRGMLRPLLVNPSLELVFEPADDVPVMFTDEAKVSQILRNFISNALKFTERGEIRVAARLAPDARAVTFTVRDTGIGIAPEDQQIIFQDFTQIDSRLQRRARGTGLGLPLTRRLAELLGGHVSVHSAPGLGSTFAATIPLVYRPAPGEAAPVGEGAVHWASDRASIPIVVVGDDQRVFAALAGAAFHVVAARDAAEARGLIAGARPRAVVVDTAGAGAGWSALTELGREAGAAGIPVIAIVGDEHEDEKVRALGVHACLRSIEELRRTLLDVVARSDDRRVLVIDDDDVARYLLRGLLRDNGFVVTEAATGADGLAKAREQRPSLIVCDVLMPEMGGLEVLRALREDPRTREIPVVMNTVKRLTPEEREDLEKEVTVVLSKETLARRDAATFVREAIVRAGLGT
jgi:signal transduction histidine kinase/CheY-like chemotaxis protein